MTPPGPASPSSGGGRCEAAVAALRTDGRRGPVYEAYTAWCKVFVPVYETLRGVGGGAWALETEVTLEDYRPSRQYPVRTRTSRSPRKATEITVGPGLCMSRAHGLPRGAAPLQAGGVRRGGRRRDSRLPTASTCINTLSGCRATRARQAALSSKLRQAVSPVGGRPRAEGGKAEGYCCLSRLRHWRMKKRDANITVWHAPIPPTCTYLDRCVCCMYTRIPC